MDEKRIFVGREAELEQFRQVLEDPRGQAILVVGQAGMGKSWLLDRMALLAQRHPDLKCGYVRYEVTPTDSTDLTMELMMDHAFETAQAEAGSFDETDQRKRQWHALFKAVIPKGSEILELAQSLRREPQKHTREQFLERLKLISRRMPKNGRAIFAVDPEKLMKTAGADSWRLVVRELPEKIKFLFAQRPRDELNNNNDFLALPNIVHIPAQRLGILSESEVDDLIRLRADGTGQSGKILMEVTSRYKGHPYAIQAALDIVKRTGSTKALPPDPTPEKIAETQWKQVCKDNDAIRLFEAYTILEIGVPDDIVLSASGLDRTTCKRLHADPYLRGLLREEGQGLRIYHAILRDHILAQMHKDERTQYHTQAAAFYRAKLKQAKDKQVAPDALAATRLPEHVLAAEGQRASLNTFVNECTPALINLGLFDAFISLSERGLKTVAGHSEEEAALLGNRGWVCQIRGDLDGAEKMHKQALEIHQNLGRLEGMASQYGNLGLIYRIRGDLDQAEKMLNQSLEIHQKLGRLEGMASNYGNLGVIYQTRGDLDQAEKMHKQALEINKNLEHLEGMARDHGNLGVIYQTRGDLDRAEEMHNLALEIDQKLGRLEGMASEYGNLGLIHRQRGDMAKAREYWTQALALLQQIGMPHMVEKVQGWIDGLPA